MTGILKFQSTLTNTHLHGLQLDGLKADLGGDKDDASDDDEDDNDDMSPGNTASTSYHLDRTPSERYAFLFRHDLGTDFPFRDFHPLPSQVPYMLNVFAENVNYFLQVVHLPTLRKQIKVSRGGDLSTLPICTQALLFSIYYAAVTSMEDDDASPDPFPVWNPKTKNK